MADIKMGSRVLKVRPNTLGIVSEIRVGMNPTKLYKDDFNHVFVACQGDYGTHAAEIWKIDENDEATSFAAANFAAVDGHRIYLVRSTTDWTSGKTTVTYAVRDTRSGTAIASNFGQVQPPIDPTTIAVDPHTKQIYIASRGTLDPKIRFTEPGTVSVYTPRRRFPTSLQRGDRTLLAPLSEEIRRALVKPRGEFGYVNLSSYFCL